MKILLVSDNENLVKTCKTILISQLGLKDTICAENENDTITQIENATETNSAAVLFGGSAVKSSSIKLVIVDEIINGKPASELIKNIRKLFNKKELPIILFTAGENKEELIKILQVGANNFILKPPSAEILNRKIAEAMGKEPIPPKIEPAGVFSQNKPVVKKRETKSPLLQMMSAPKKKSGGGNLIGAYYSSKPDNKTTTGEGAQPVLDDGTLINGHYREEVNVIGGGVNCFWAKEKPGEKQIALEYISAKGKPSGMFVKNVSKGDFLKNFCPCTPETCNIMKRNMES